MSEAIPWKSKPHDCPNTIISIIKWRSLESRSKWWKYWHQYSVSWFSLDCSILGLWYVKYKLEKFLLISFHLCIFGSFISLCHMSLPLLFYLINQEILTLFYFRRYICLHALNDVSNNRSYQYFFFTHWVLKDYTSIKIIVLFMGDHL